MIVHRSQHGLGCAGDFPVSKGVDRKMRAHANDNHRISVCRATTYINDNATEPISLAQLSQVAGMSAFHFSRKFKAITGVSPHQYILMKRIEQSKALLAASERPIAHIAIECGFSSQAHFSVAFKNRVGFSPRRYRDQERER